MANVLSAPEARQSTTITPVHASGVQRANTQMLRELRIVNLVATVHLPVGGTALDVLRAQLAVLPVEVLEDVWFAQRGSFRMNSLHTSALTVYLGNFHPWRKDPAVICVRRAKQVQRREQQTDLLVSPVNLEARQLPDSHNAANALWADFQH